MSKKMLAVVIAALTMITLLLTSCTNAESTTSANKPQKTETLMASAQPVGSMILSFITIGKGDAFLLQTPQDQFYLIDTGRFEDYDQIVKTLETKGVKDIAGIILSHGHKDHIGCLEKLIKNYSTKIVYLSSKDTATYDREELKALTTQTGTELIELNCWDTIDLGGAVAEVWIPKQTDVKNENNNSMVVKVTHGNNAMLFMGDAELKEESALLSSGMQLSADILKLGHHGEDDATTTAFLKKVAPTYALITGNETENPDSVNAVVSKNLEAFKVQSFYSECDGIAIDFISDGNTIVIQTVPYPSSIPAEN